jgi:hypothetical protein
MMMSLFVVAPSMAKQEGKTKSKGAEKSATKENSGRHAGELPAGEGYRQKGPGSIPSAEEAPAALSSAQNSLGLFCRLTCDYAYPPFMNVTWIRPSECVFLRDVRSVCYSAFAMPGLGMTWATISLLTGLTCLIYKKCQRRGFQPQQ